MELADMINAQYLEYVKDCIKINTKNKKNTTTYRPEKKEKGKEDNKKMGKLFSNNSDLKKVADNVEYGRKDVLFTRIVEWLYLNDKQFSSGIEWKQAFIKFLKEIL